MLRCFMIARALRPQSSALHIQLGRHYYNWARYDKATQYFKKAVELQSNCAIAVFDLGRVYQKQNKPEKAVRAFQKAVQLENDYPEAYYELGHALQALGKFDQAAEAYKQTVSLKSDHYAALFDLGDVYRKHGKFKQALKAYQEASRHKSRFSDAGWHRRLARSLRECEKLVEVQAYLHKRGAMLIFGEDGLSVQGSMKLSDQKLVKGKLTKDSSLLKKKHHAIQKLAIKADCIYVVDLNSEEFDPFLLLTNAIGKVLDQDDDGGEGLNSRLIVIGEKDAQHEIVATTFQPGATGNYTLRIREYTLTGKGKKADSKKEK